MTHISSQAHRSNKNTLVQMGSPRLSIGLPVYNASNYIHEAVDSILNQSFKDFELIISDNASTDETAEICKEYAKKDSRIRYYRNETNIGAARNFNRVFDLSSTEYFMWAAHDDVYSPYYLKSCIEVLDRDPTVVLCHAKPIIIDRYGEELKGYMEERNYFKLKNTGSSKPHKRFYDLVCRRHLCFPIFGMLRSYVLHNTPRLGEYLGADRNLLAEIALLGRFHEVDEVVYFRRHEEQYSSIADVSEKAKWFDAKSKGHIVIRFKRNFVEYMRSIMRSPINWHEKLFCYFCMCIWALKKRKKLFNEIILAKNTIANISNL